MSPGDAGCVDDVAEDSAPIGHQNKGSRDAIPMETPHCRETAESRAEWLRPSFGTPRRRLEQLSDGLAEWSAENDRTGRDRPVLGDCSYDARRIAQACLWRIRGVDTVSILHHVHPAPAGETQVGRVGRLQALIVAMLIKDVDGLCGGLVDAAP